MRLMAGDAGAIGGDAFVRVGDLHHGGLADDRERGARKVLAETRDGVEAAGAGGLLVIAQHDVDRLFELCREKFRRHGEAKRVETLHVACAASIKPFAVAPQHEGRRGPFLAHDRHHIGMAR